MCAVLLHAHGCLNAILYLQLCLCFDKFVCDVSLHVYCCLNVILYLHGCLCLDKCVCCLIACAFVFECNLVFAFVFVR